MRIDRFKWLLAVASIVAMGMVGCDDDDGGEPTDDMDMIGDTSGDTGTDTSTDTGTDTNVDDDTTDVDDDATDVDDDTTDVDDDTTDVDDDMVDTTDTTDVDDDMTDTEDMVDMEDMADMCMAEPEVSWAACMDGVDNDCDGGIDDTVGCMICPPEGDTARTTDEIGTCDDGLDNDCDGFADCADFDCDGDVACPTEDTDTLCSDGIDNDGDGRIDCAGRSCTEAAAVTICDAATTEDEATEALCSDGLDNDGDDRLDCDDDGCSGIGYCAAAEVDSDCTDGNDNDGDGRVDCLDNSCFDHTSCQGEDSDTACSDGLDNDGDGRVDCADDSCYLNPGVNVCSGLDEICDNMMDDDGDGLDDCFDPSCGATCETQACSATNPVGTCANAGEVCTTAGECGVTLDAFTLPDDQPLLITEFQPDPAVTGSDGEFIEILNTTTQRIVLDGASLDDSANSFMFPPGISVGAGESLLLGSAGVTDPVGFTPDAFFPWGLNNGGDTVTLSFGGTTIHEVVYPGTGNDLGNTGFGAGDGQSTQLDQDYIASVLAGTPGTPLWCLTPPDMANEYFTSTDMTLHDYGTPGTANVACSTSCGNATCDPWEDATSCLTDCDPCGDGTCDPATEDNASCAADCFCGNNSCDTDETTISCTLDCLTGAQQPDAAGDVVITEIMQNPTTVGDTSGEWFEIHNPSSLTTYNLQGCVISDAGTDTHTIGMQLSIAPGAYVTLAVGDMPGFTPDYVYSSFSLANGDDEVILTCGGTMIDTVAYDGSPNFPDPTGASMSLDPTQLTATANDTGSNWCEATTSYNTDLGTPGAANDACP